MADLTSDIIYNVQTGEESVLPTQSSADNFNFSFLGFTPDDPGAKPFVFVAKLTPQKKQKIWRSLIPGGDVDDKEISFNWDGRIIHIDTYKIDYEALVDQGEIEQEIIYFVRKDDSEIITPENYQEKISHFEQSEFEILQNAFDTLVEALIYIEEHKESQS